MEESSYKLLGPVVGDNEVHDDRIDDYNSTVAVSRPQQRRQIPYIRWLSYGVKTIILLVALYGASELGRKLYTRWPSPKHDRFICDCGSSLSEAKEMGCEYVAMAAAYLPPHCRDPELEEQFDHAGPGPNGEWAYYADGNGSKTYSRDEVASFGGVGGDLEIWTTKAWHITHCAYYWRKEIRLQQTGAIMEPRNAGESHAKHCMKQLLTPGTLEEISTRQQISLTSHGKDLK
jgi:hypothetical protein